VSHNIKLFSVVVFPFTCFYCFWCCCWCCSWTSIKFCQCLHVDIAANTHSCGLLVIFFLHIFTLI